MPAPLVVVEVPVADRGDPLADALLKACSEGVAQGRCILGTDREEPEVIAVAIVTWEDQRRVVNVTVGRRRSQRAEWLQRRIEFKAFDAPTERWRAAGLVIATLVGEAQRQEEARAAAAAAPTEAGASPAAKEAPKTPPEAPKTSPEDVAPVATAHAAERKAATRAPEREIAWIDAGVTADSGIGDAWFRWGGWFRASLRPATLQLYVFAGGRYSGMPTDDGGLSLHWASGSVGVGGFMELAPAIRVEAHVETLAQVVWARATDASGASDGSQRWVGGLRLGADVVWTFAPMWALVGGAEAGAFSSGTVLRVAGERRGRDAPFDVGALVGARVVFR
jgi:hypothetical protein